MSTHDEDMTTDPGRALAPEPMPPPPGSSIPHPLAPPAALTPPIPPPPAPLPMPGPTSRRRPGPVPVPARGAVAIVETRAREASLDDTLLDDTLLDESAGVVPPRSRRRRGSGGRLGLVVSIGALVGVGAILIGVVLPSVVGLSSSRSSTQQASDSTSTTVSGEAPSESVSPVAPSGPLPTETFEPGLDDEFLAAGPADRSLTAIATGRTI
ncbi:MAG: hypothetical protein R2705_07390 [Ilumatobacteraceae bacterium]